MASSKLMIAVLVLVWPFLVGAETVENWALQPLKKPVPPQLDDRGWVRNGIDRFVLARLRAKGLEPAREADKATLIRRLSYDLIGLPPTPEELQAFTDSKEAKAYEMLVDRLLASPRYGERWARHWLDVARYTESQGFEYDRLRNNAWHYRDYVIKAFNSDKPYDQFVREQIAGDVIEPVTSESMVATSLLVCGPYDQAGNSQQNQTQRMITREEEMDDLVSVVSQSFLGLTVNCARCHAHKYDPIPQADYYRMKAVFDGVIHGERDITSPAEKTADPGKTNTKKQEKIKKKPWSGKSYIGKRRQPDPTRRLERGSVKQPAEAVSPRGLSAITEPSPDFGLSPDAPEAERRRKFAEWVVHPRNPLTPRVMTNRVWHYHFGLGIVPTPSDLGQAGVPPSHPALLDWLAVGFVEKGWSIKQLHRLIVTSATYRQSSALNVEAAKIDAGNRLLWRYAPRRLEAEAVRDAMLTVSGQLNLKMGGESFRPFSTSEHGSTFYQLEDRDEPEFNRRTIYRINVNSGKDPLLDAFDCPDPAVKTPRRMLTVTPLQALSMMNNSFVQRQAKHLAERMIEETSGDTDKAIELMYRYAFGRTANSAELEQARQLAAEFGMKEVAWIVLNATEFLYVR